MRAEYREGERFSHLDFTEETFYDCDFSDCTFIDCTFEDCIKSLPTALRSCKNT